MPEATIGISEMLKVQSTEFKFRFSEFLDRAQQGETIVITRYGKVVARLVPPEEDEQASDDSAAESRQT